MSLRYAEILHKSIKVYWFYVILSSLIFFILALPIQYKELVQVCSRVNCPGRQLTPANAAALQEIGVSLEFRSIYIIVVDTIGFLLFLALAIFLFWKRSDDWFAMFLGLTFVSYQADNAAIVLQSILPSWYLPFIYLFSIGSTTFPIIFYLFPDGRPIPRWTLYLILGWLGSLTCMLLLFIPMPELQTRFEDIQPIFWITIFLGSMLAQFYRYWYISTQIQKQQTKWVVYALFMTLSVLVPWIFITQYIQASGISSKIVIVDFIDNLIGLYFSAILSLSFGIAILRYKLWDIDLVIRRTLVYGMLTATLAFIYYLSVVLLQQLLPTESEFTILLSTLGVAALFSPLRRRIQDTIDKRFYRRRYDAEHTISAFASTLRDEVELEKIANTLIETVDETMQPEHISLWLRLE